MLFKKVAEQDIIKNKVVQVKGLRGRKGFLIYMDYYLLLSPQYFYFGSKDVWRNGIDALSILEENKGGVIWWGMREYCKMRLVIPDRFIKEEASSWQKRLISEDWLILGRSLSPSPPPTTLSSPRRLFICPSFHLICYHDRQVFLFVYRPSVCCPG